MNKIEIYTANTCGYCKVVKDELTKNNIKFEEKLTVDFKEEFKDIVSLTGMPTTPTIKYEEEYFVAGRDFGSPQLLIQLLKTFKPCNYDNSRRTFEKIKTLNYNMSNAFGRLDQLLRKIETKINTDEHKSTD
tara:strand:- start:355 stop:750 length:396 start_codon:yes stop_codon:yes gene_type:complete